MSIQVDFLGVGPQRTASSWLYEVLRHHPGIHFPEGVKETMFFDLRFDRGWGYYASHFRHAADGQRVGEIAPSYFHSVAAVDRVADAAPQCKIIISVRNPVVRSHSLFRHHLSKGRVPNDFAAALEKMPEILESGHYATYAPVWEDRLSAGQILYLVQEDMETDPAGVLARVCAFLEVETIPLPPVATNTKVNTAAAPRNRAVARVLSLGARGLRALRMHRAAELGKSLGLLRWYQGGGQVDPLRPEMYQQLLRYYAADIEWLEQRLQRSFDAWKIVPTEKPPKEST